LLTRCWREMDSNFQYAGAVNLFVAPFCRTRLLEVAAGDAEPQETTRAFQG